MTDALSLYELLLALRDLGAEVELRTADSGTWYVRVKHAGLDYREAYYHKSLTTAMDMLRRDLEFLLQAQEGT